MYWYWIGGKLDKSCPTGNKNQIKHLKMHYICREIWLFEANSSTLIKHSYDVELRPVDATAAFSAEIHHCSRTQRAGRGHESRMFTFIKISRWKELIWSDRFSIITKLKCQAAIDDNLFCVFVKIWSHLSVCMRTLYTILRYNHYKPNSWLIQKKERIS